MKRSDNPNIKVGYCKKYNNLSACLTAVDYSKIHTQIAERILITLQNIFKYGKVQLQSSNFHLAYLNRPFRIDDSSYLFPVYKNSVKFLQMKEHLLA